MRAKLIVSYQGKAYGGWQIQKNANTIEAEIYQACEKAGIEQAKLIGSGRTDAGVHAMGQVALLTGESSLPADRLSFILNHYLPEDIRILRSEEADPDFHPRYQAKRKTYLYTLRQAKIESVFYRDYAWNFPHALDEGRMREAMDLLKGEHDFKAYMSSGSDIKSTVRTLYQIDLKVSKDPDGAMIYRFSYTGNGFLYNMVRILTGTIVMVGCGKKSLEDVRKSLETGERHYAGNTAPAQGLMLMQVDYDC